MYKKKPKYMNVDLSYEYYINGKNNYKPRDCHANVYNQLTDICYDEMIEKGEHFVLCTGLLVYELNGKNQCYIHS